MEKEWKMQNKDVVVFKNILKRYPTDFLLQIDSLILQSDSLYCLQGINGSGKSTLLAILLDLILPDSGEIFILDNKHTSNTAKQYISSFLDKDRLLDFLTVKEYFYLIGSSYNKTKIEVENNYAKINSFFNRSYFYDKKLIKDYSGGNRQLIGLMAAFIVNSPVIILDEPFNFLDTKTAEAFCDFMNSYHIECHAVILFTSNSNNFFGLKDINFLNIKDGKIYE